MRLSQPLLALDRAYSAAVHEGRGQYLVARMVAATRFFGVRPPVIVTDGGVEIEYSPRHAYDGLIRALVRTGVYEPEQLEILRRATPDGGTFVDVGANIGYFTLNAARWVGRSGHVYALEPAPRTYRTLVGNIELNGAGNVSPFALALGSRTGTAGLTEYQDSGFTHLSDEDPPGDGVEVTTLDAFAREQGIERLDVLKIDVEGCELQVIRGGREALESFRPTILVEVGHLERFGDTEDALDEAFGALGYRGDPVSSRLSRDRVYVPLSKRHA